MSSGTSRKPGSWDTIADLEHELGDFRDTIIMIYDENMQSWPCSLPQTLLDEHRYPNIASKDFIHSMFQTKLQLSHDSNMTKSPRFAVVT